MNNRMARKFGHRAFSSRVSLAAALLLLAVHCVLSLLFPQGAWITPVAWIGLYAVALAVALDQWHRSASETRWKWALIATNFSFSIVSFLCILDAEYWVPGSPSAAWLNSLMRAWKSLALLLAVCTPEEIERPFNRLLDGLQALLIGLVFFVLFSPNLFLHGGPVSSPLDAPLVNRYNYTEAILLAFLTLLAVFTARTRDSRLFHTALAIYLWIGVPVSLWTNEVLINTWYVPPASTLFMFSDFCLLAFIVAVPALRGKLPPTEPGPRLMFLRLGASAFLPLFGLLASMLLAVTGHHPILGIAAALTSLAIYGLRSTYGQFQLLAAHTELRTANIQLEELSERDPLTGLYNRRWLSEHLALEWKRAQRGTEAISLLLIDIDHFKLFNDTQGHEQGDHCLREVANLLAKFVTRDTDALVRYGGEEFVALLPNTSAEGNFKVAQSMIDAFAAREIPHPASPLGYVTVSIGAATVFRPSLESESRLLFLRADEALYRAKAEGRNTLRSAAEVNA
jgi:diguanylate cyclase (GGDEF)-like protein